MGRLSPAIALAIALSGNGAWGQEMDREITPAGKFRVGMNGNNSTLVKRQPDGTVGGLSAELGKFIAAKLGVPYEAIVYESSTPFTASFSKSEWEIVLTGKNAVVAKLVDFGPDLFLVEYMYIAAPGRAFSGPAVVDAPGVRVAVPRNASADVYLSGTLKSAEIVRVDGDLNVGIELLRAGKADVYATSGSNVRLMAGRLPEGKILGAFNTVVFAVAMRKGLSPEAQRRLTQLIGEAKAAGIVQKALAGAEDVRLAP